MRVLVTGGSGFIGTRVVERLANRGDSVVAFDLSMPAGAGRRTDVTYVLGDITDAASVEAAFDAQSINAVVHCAAIVGVTTTLEKPQVALNVNISGTINVLNAMRDHRINRMIHISSNEVYGDYQSTIINEDHPTRPLMAYGISKLAAEQFCRTYHLLHGIECIHLRGAWIYAPDFPRPRLPNVLLDRVLRGEAVRFESGGDSIMDFLHAADFVDAVVLALDKQNHRFDTYNIGSGNGTSLFQLIELVRALLPDAEIHANGGNYEFLPGVGMRIQGALDIGRASHQLHFQPKFSLADGLTEHIQKYTAPSLTN